MDKSAEGEGMAASAAEKPSRLLDAEGLRALSEAVRTLELAFAKLPEFERATSGAEEISATLMATAERLQNTYPYHHPLYAGQMLKPPHPIALLTYTLAMSINPNNHALEGGRATSPMEKEAVAQIAAMFGWETFLGHLCGGGTMANLEALWVAGQLAPGKTILASAQAHYTHERISKVSAIAVRNGDLRRARAHGRACFGDAVEARRRVDGGGDAGNDRDGSG